MFVDFNEEIEVSYSGFAGQYFLQVDLVHDPKAGPMVKRFQSPIDDTSRPILLDAEQPAPQVVSEEFSDETLFPEDEIRVWEYPTPVPEPAAGWLLAIGSAIVLIAIGRQP